LHGPPKSPCADHLHALRKLARKVAIVRPYLVAENQMCFVAAHADASETIDGMTLRRQAKKRA
jgi:hypothetical protein